MEMLFAACVLAALVGLALHFLYHDAFIQENYRSIKMFRRLAYPSIGLAIRRLDRETEQDLSEVYVETDIVPESLALTIDCGGEDYQDILDEIEPVLMRNGFRPEVILASLGTTDGPSEEVGNWVLTAPNRKHIESNKLNGIHEALLLFMAKNQLHLRIFYDDVEDELRFYVHFERNPYNPLYAHDHFEGNGLDIEEGEHLYRKVVSKDIYIEVLMASEYDYEYRDP